MAIVGSILVVVIITAGISIADKNNDENYGHDDSSSNAGDGVPDGSDHEAPNGPNGDSDSESGHATPAPNSGDCVPDGPGWS